MTSYYNENDPYCVSWLQALILAGKLPEGWVDARSVTDIFPRDLNSFDHCHFFAGIGMWSYALQLAGWPDDEPVWTGSLPCQPFSDAGRHQKRLAKRKLGFSDERNLWPYFNRVIAECRPAVIFGEQVAGAAGLEWMRRVRLNLERSNYAVGMAVLSAAGAGSPTTRQRIYWVAESKSTGRRGGQTLEKRGRTKLGRSNTRTSTQTWPDPRRSVSRHSIADLCLPPDGNTRGVAQLYAKAIGNSIVPQVAASFIKAYMECLR